MACSLEAEGDFRHDVVHPFNGDDDFLHGIAGLTDKAVATLDF